MIKQDFLSLATAFCCFVLFRIDACLSFLRPLCFMRSLCWALGRLLFETNLVYVVSGLGLLVQDGALFIEK